MTNSCSALAPSLIVILFVKSLLTGFSINQDSLLISLLIMLSLIYEAPSKIFVSLNGKSSQGNYF
jgi:hypothetical protein